MLLKRFGFCRVPRFVRYINYNKCRVHPTVNYLKDFGLSWRIMEEKSESDSDIVNLIVRCSTSLTRFFCPNGNVISIICRKNESL